MTFLFVKNTFICKTLEYNLNKVAGWGCIVPTALRLVGYRFPPS